MQVNWHRWKVHFSSSFIPEIDHYRSVWAGRFLPSVEEADRIYEEARERHSGTFNTEYSRGDEIEQWAHDKALDFYCLHGLRQGMLNLYAVGLYHLLEQQALLFFREGLASVDELAWTFGHVKTKLAYDHHVYLEKLSSWPKIQDLRLLANCVKHAEARRPKLGKAMVTGGKWYQPGRKLINFDKLPEEACKSLRNRRPEWFTPGGPPLLAPRLVSQPMYGDGIHVDEAALWDLTGAAKVFWAELGEVLAPDGR
jgi:hypothetical protein